MNVREKLSEKAKMAGVSLGAVLMSVSTMFPMVMATDLQSMINSIGNQIYGLITGIAAVSCGVVVAWCLLTMLLSKDEKKVSQSMDWLKRAVICFVCIFLVSTILNWVTTNLGLNGNATLDGIFG